MWYFNGFKQTNKHSRCDPHCLLQFTPDLLQELQLGPATLIQSRANGFRNMLETIHKRARMLLKDYPKFPSLIITADQLIPQGSFAKAQALYLQPSDSEVAELATLLTEKKVGVVAHFYMDPQVRILGTCIGCPDFDGQFIHY